MLHTVRDNNESTLCSQQPQDGQTPYLNLSVCLSPTSSLVKNDVKPNLVPGKTLTCGGVSFDSSTILKDIRFRSFLYDVTTCIITRLLTFVGDPDLKINAMLLSGRSCRLQALRQALEGAMAETGNPDARIIKFGSDDEKDKDKEKTVVVEGGMARAGIFSYPDSPVSILSKRLYASYGLIYQAEGGSWRYTELLKGSDLPYIPDRTSLDDFEGPNVIVNTTWTNSLKLIQTYLSPEETEKAFNANDFEFISEMEEFNTASFDRRDNLNVKLKLDYKNNVSLYVNGLNTRGSSPKGVDLSSEITKRSIWPVTI